MCTRGVFSRAANNYCVDSHSEPLNGCFGHRHQACSRFYSVPGNFTMRIFVSALGAFCFVFLAISLRRVLRKRIQMSKVPHLKELSCASAADPTERWWLSGPPACYPFLLNFYLLLCVCTQKSGDNFQKLVSTFHLYICSKTRTRVIGLACLSPFRAELSRRPTTAS